MYFIRMCFGDLNLFYTTIDNVLGELVTGKINVSEGLALRQYLNCSNAKAVAVDLVSVAQRVAKDLRCLKF